MNLRTAKILSKLMLVAAVVFYLAAAVLMQYTAMLSPEIFAAGGTVLLAAALLVRLVWAKCPHCGRHIGYKQLNLTECPYCRKTI